jgi:hypothetical protein
MNILRATARDCVPSKCYQMKGSIRRFNKSAIFVNVRNERCYSTRPIISLNSKLINNKKQGPQRLNYGSYTPLNFIKRKEAYCGIIKWLILFT